jgi:hypothetical protein
VNCDDPLIDCSEEEEVDVPWGLDPSKEEDQKDYLDTQVPIDDCEFWRTDCPNLEEL